MRNTKTVALELIASLGAAALTVFTVLVGFAVGMSFPESNWIPVVGCLLPASLCIAVFWSRRWVVITAALAAATFLFSIPLVTTGGRDAIRAEAEQMLGSMKGQTRLAYAKLDGHDNIRTLTGPVGQGGCGIEPDELQGKYFRVRDEVTVAEIGFTLFADPISASEHKGSCAITVNWAGGDGVFTWTPP